VTGLGLNTLFLAGTGGLRLDPFMAYDFFIEIEGLITGGFSEVSGLQVETEVYEYREGGQNAFVHRLAGPTRYPQNLVLKRGLSIIPTLWDWHQAVIGGTIRRRNATIFLLNQQRLPLIWWNVAQAYPVRWSGPELRADSSSVAFEAVELVHEGISRFQL
jgi:phage tail-like protein